MARKTEAFCRAGHEDPKAAGENERPIRGSAAYYGHIGLRHFPYILGKSEGSSLPQLVNENPDRLSSQLFTSHPVEQGSNRRHRGANLHTH